MSLERRQERKRERLRREKKEGRGGNGQDRKMDVGNPTLAKLRGLEMVVADGYGTDLSAKQGTSCAVPSTYCTSHFT